MRESSDGETLDVGRKTRTIPPSVRRALRNRDGGCRFPACTCRHCDAHHVAHWADGGKTKLTNLLLLCRRHHRAVHEGGFTVKLGAKGEARFFRPDGRELRAVPPVRAVGEWAFDAVAADDLPVWDGSRFDLGLVMDSLWRPPAAAG